MLSINNTTQDIDSKIISDKQTLINQTSTSTKPPVLSLEDLTMNINKSAVDDINNNPILKLNSKATTEYITSLHNKLHELQNENGEQPTTRFLIIGILNNVFDMEDNLSCTCLGDFFTKECVVS